MSIRSVVTRGYATGGSIALVVVRGYGFETRSGGARPWAMLGIYDRYSEEKRQREAEQRQVHEKVRAIKDKTDAEIARHMHEQLEYEARTEEIGKLEVLVKAGHDQREAELARAYNAGVAKAYERALQIGTFAAVEAFEREMERAMEEEEFLLLAIVTLQ